MFFPLCIFRTEDGTLIARSPLIDPSIKFDGKTTDALIANVRETLPLISIKPFFDMQDVIDNAGPEFAGGEWIAMQADAPDEPDKQQIVNLSLRKRLIIKIDRARRSAGLTRSRWLAEAAAEKLSRGM
jgi:hypothetical protein